jgi:ribonucleoside-diphosphate reductase subunit M2
MDQSEFVESESEKRYTVFPLKDLTSWETYNKAVANFWIPEEINKSLTKDKADWDVLDDDIKHLVKYVLAFFAVSDGLVNEGISEKIMSRIQTKECKIWYGFQYMMEDIHGIVYSRIIDNYVTNKQEQEKLFNAIENFASIRMKVNWIKKHMGSSNELDDIPDEMKKTLKHLKTVYLENLKLAEKVSGTNIAIKDDLQNLFDKLDQPRPSLAKLVLINTIMEGVFFSASFAIIFWINHQYPGKLPGLVKANEFISRDEALHALFGVNLYKRMKNKPSQKEVYQIFDEAVEIEFKCIEEALPNRLINMNGDLLKQYIKFVADGLLLLLGYSKLYNVENPFDFMMKQSCSYRSSDFFSVLDVSEYGQAYANTKTSDLDLVINDEF